MLRGLLKIYAFVIGLAFTLGIGEVLVKGTISMANMAVEAHQKGPISFGELNRMLLIEPSRQSNQRTVHQKTRAGRSNHLAPEL